MPTIPPVYITLPCGRKILATAIEREHDSFTEALSAQKLTVPGVLILVRKYYALPGNMCGGNLHIVLDDGNINDGCVRFCIERATKAGDTFGAQLAEILLKCSVTQRRKLYAAKKS